MNRQHCFRLKHALVALLMSLCICCGIVRRAIAAAPWEVFAPVPKVDADPQNSYPVAESNGPWMIMAATFQGDSADEQARQLVYEFRSKYHLPAYTHTKSFDFTQRVQGRGLDPRGNPKMMHYQQDKMLKETAVLVGDYNTVDDPAAQKVLAKIKQLDPDCIHADKDKPSTLQAAFNQLQQPFLAANNEKKIKGPLSHAFICTNPLLPPEYFTTKGVDNLIVEMNKDVPNSLLDCRGQYTVKVATFTGVVLLNQKKIDEVEHGKRMGSRLEEAAEKAHKLSTALRQKGYEAYEFHDRESSIVCVGSFAALGSQGADGKFVLNPTIELIIKTFGPDPHSVTSGNIQPKSLDGIPFDVQPVPIEVPRRSIGADYQRSMLSER